MADRVGQQLGNYRLTQLLGQGGFAEVYLAEHVHLGNKVAVKLLYGKLSAQDIEAFTNEARTLAVLRHPCVLRVLDFGFEQALPFLVMEYAPGGTLRDRHPRGSILPLATVVSYTKQVSSALAHAHTRKLIHRDVKPENMLIDADGNILLGDFGIVALAHSTASMKTVDNTGTAHYMAPEQIQGKPRPASDQYALAIVIYEWLCGERPFTGDNLMAIAMQQLTAAPPSLRAKGAVIPLEVEEVILKALEKDPLQRFPDITAFSNALEQSAHSQKDASTVPPASSPSPTKPRSLLTRLLQPRSYQSKNHQPLPPTVPAQPVLSTLTYTKPIEPLKELSNKAKAILATILLPSEEKLIKAYREVQHGQITDPVSIDAIADTFEQIAQDPQASAAYSFDARRASSNLRAQAEQIRKVEPTFQSRLHIRETSLHHSPLSPEEEMLISYTQGLPSVYDNRQAYAQLQMMKDVMRDSAEFFRQLPDDGRRVVAAFDKALSQAYHLEGILALSRGKAEFLKLFERYDEALIAYTQGLPSVYDNRQAYAQLQMMKDVMRDSAEFFRQLPDDGRRVVAAFDEALSQASHNEGILALSRGKAEFLKLFRRRCP